MPWDEDANRAERRGGALYEVEPCRKGKYPNEKEVKEKKMTQEIKEITKYTLSRMTNFSNVRAVIWLYSGNEAFARLVFLARQVPKKLIVQDYGGGRKILWVYYPIEAISDIVDILRNEKPVHLVYEKTMGYARVVTGAEPVGEGEDAT